jgi:hypothetical protein
LAITASKRFCAAPCRFCLRFCQRQRGAVHHVIEPCEDLALFHGHSFLDVHFDDLARDLRRDRCAPASRDVSGRVQHGRLCAGRPLSHGGHLDLDRPLAGEVAVGRGTGSANEDQQHDPLHPRERDTRFGRTVDAEGGEVVLQFSHGL